jgi:hypothetical protein
VSDVTRYSLAPTFSKSYPGSNHNRRSIQLTQLSVYPDQLRLLLAQPKLLRYVAKYQGMRERPSAKWFIATHGISNDPPQQRRPPARSGQSDPGISDPSFPREDSSAYCPGQDDRPRSGCVRESM